MVGTVELERDCKRFDHVWQGPYDEVKKEWESMDGMGMGGMMSGMGIIGMLFWIIILGLLFYGVYLLFARMSRGPERKPEETRMRDTSDILKERLARGEIDEEEYERLKKRLEEE